MMRKLLLSLVTILFLISFTPAYTTEESKTKEWTFPQSYYWYQVPVVCGAEHEVRTHLHELGFIAEEWSLGRSDGKSYGEPVYMIIVYYNKDRSQKISMMKLPGNPNVCLMNLTFDVTKEKPKKLPE